MSKKSTTTTDLDIFTPAPEETSVAESRIEIVSVNVPLPNDDVNTPLEFRLPSTTDWYTDFSPAILEIYMKIQYAGQQDPNIPRVKEIGLVNNILMTMFSGLSVFWNNQQVIQNNNCLPWSAYLDVLAQYPYDARKSWLSASGWYDGGLGGVTAQAMKAFQPFYDSGTGRFIGPIQMDFFRMRKYIIPGVEMMLRFYRQDPNFYIINMKDPTKNESFKVVIERAYLHVRRIKLFEGSHMVIEKRLLTTPAIYEFFDTTMKPIIVPENIFSIDVTLHEGILPSRLDIIQMSQADFTGPATNSPFAFQHADMRSVTLEKNGQIVAPPYQCDFAKSNYARMFLDYFKNSGCSLDKAGMSEISYDKFKAGYTIMSFNLERFDECTSNIQPMTDYGSLRLKIEYDAASAAVSLRPLVILCLFKFKRAVKLNAQRMLAQ